MVLIAGFCVAAAGRTATPTTNCEAIKNKIAGQYAACRQSAEATALKRGREPNHSACEVRFAKKWLRAETRAAARSAPCPTVGDVFDMASLVTEHTGAVAAALSGASCPGTRDSGFCFVLGVKGESCTLACTRSRLAYDDVGTRAFVGSDGAIGHCSRLLDLLGAPGVGPYGGSDCDIGAGCVVQQEVRGWCETPTTDADASHTIVRRLCACM